MTEGAKPIARDAAFLRFCREMCSPNAESSVWYRQIFEAGWDAALRAAPSPEGVGLARDGWELKEAHRRIEAALPEDEPDCVPDWVCRILVGYGRELGPEPNEILGPVGQEGPSEPEGGG